MKTLSQTLTLNGGELTITVDSSGNIYAGPRLDPGTLQLTALELNNLVELRRVLRQAQSAASVCRTTTRNSNYQISFLDGEAQLMQDVDGLYVGCQHISDADLDRIHQISRSMR